jgi:serum/glucocorticoid-regulated kinase 2
MSESGLVFLTVKEILNLNIADPTDVYCVISVEKQIIRTSSCKVTKANPVPEWNEGFTFDITIHDAEMGIAVWGKSPKFPSGKLLGLCEVPVAQAKAARVLEKTIPMVDGNYNPSPVEVSFKANYASPSHKVGFDDFIMLRYLGRGTFGKVMLVKKKDTNRLYATKIMRKDTLYREGMVDFPFIERHLLKKFNHPNVVHLKYCFQTETHLYMVMDYISGGELFDLLESRVTLLEDEARFFAAQIVLAIGFLHEHDIIYRDLKPENCLLDMRGDLCLIDFGLSKEGIKDGEYANSFCGSLQYMAPEILKGRQYGKAVDWWALGIILHEMLTGAHPFLPTHECDILTEKDVLDRVVGAPIELPPNLSKEARSLIKGLLVKEPTLRLGAGSTSELRNHEFFAKIHWKNLEAKKIEPPLKPHLDPSPEVGLDPWASVDGDDSNFEILSHSQQEHFKSFSYVAPSELSRSASSPVIGAFSPSPVFSPRPLYHLQKLKISSSPLHSPHLSPRLSTPSPVFSTSPSPVLFSSSPRTLKSSGMFKVVKSPAFYDLSQYAADREEQEAHANSPPAAKLHISQHRR